MIRREKTTLDGIRSLADYSDCESYRYWLERTWGDTANKWLAFVMLNPSTATEEKNDPTVQRCEKRARAGGYCGIVITNLFAYRATEPGDMKKADDPVGADNNRQLQMLAGMARNATVDVIAAWGAHGSFRNRDKKVLEIFKDRQAPLLALALTKEGQPRHPLYLPGNLQPKPYP